MRANYSTTVNLEKRQSLNSFIVSVEGTTVDQVVDSLEPSSVILDIGCGNGLWMAPAGRAGDVVGIDLSRPMLRDARARSGNPVACGDAVRLPVRDHTVDVALMLWMLYHVDKPTALQEVTRVLRPGGQVLAATNAASEEGPHAEIIRQALGEVLGREVEPTPSPGTVHSQGALPPGNSHPPAKAIRARHCAGVAVRETEPTSRGSDRPRVTMRATPASHMRRWIAESGIEPWPTIWATRPKAPWADRPSRVSMSTSTLNSG